MKKKTLIGILIFLGVLGILCYNFFQFTEFLDELGECGMSYGPIYGRPISVNLDELNLDQQIEISKGKFGLANLSDTLPPKLLKFDSDENLIWAVEFREDPFDNFPHHKLSEMILEKEKGELKLSFFNNSYGEPGVIYLTENYEIEYMCLSPM